MSRFESITIREVESSDLETFYEHQLDPEAIRMAAFVCEDPKDKVAFDAHWNKILNSSQNTTRTIVAEGQVALPPLQAVQHRHPDQRPLRDSMRHRGHVRLLTRAP